MREATAGERNAEVAREILTTQSYVVLSTADADGTPWATPVWFATEDFTQLFWVSHPGARHSRNLAARGEVAMVVFDSTAAPNTGQAVYVKAEAAEVSEDLEEGLGVFSRKGGRAGMEPWTADRVSGEARLRLYRAVAREHWILDPDSAYDERVRVEP